MKGTHLKVSKQEVYEDMSQMSSIRNKILQESSQIPKV